jgi:hypothetical protein
MASLGTYLRLMRAGFILVREGVVSSLPAEDLPGPARFAHGVAGLLAKRRAKAPSAPTGSPGPWSAWARPGSSSASSSPPVPMWSAPTLPTISPACRTAWRPSPRPRPAPQSRFARPADQRSLFALRSADRGGFDRTGSPRRSHRRKRHPQGCRQGGSPGRPPALQARSRGLLSGLRAAGTLHSRLPPAAPGGNHQDT